jgi:8-oxo-dGTP diphosphatase
VLRSWGVRGDGDGWVELGDGSRRWGRFGAAGLLLRAPAPEGSGPLVLAQLRVAWSHHGGTWGLPGGARDSHESATEAALREAAEEAGIDPADVSPRAFSVEDLGGDPTGWTYTTVVADAAAPLPTVANHESTELRWVPEAELTGLPLHPALRSSWPSLRATVRTLVVDTANLLGSIPDGWWRDRVGSTAGLLESLAATVPRTIELPVARQLPGTPERPGELTWLAGVVAVLEGRARDAPDVDGINVVRASGQGDDAVVAAVADTLARGLAPLVVTADRGLRDRLPAGVPVLGPAAVRDWR